MEEASEPWGGEVEFSPDEDEGQHTKGKKAQKKARKLAAQIGGFQKLGLSQEVLKGVLRKGYRLPTPIQRKAIPLILSGNDVVGMARTGSGKTAAFVLPLLHKLQSHSMNYGARALILSPTRELAYQTMRFLKDLGRGTDLRACLLVGGDDMEDQFAQLTQNPDVLIATPGRLLHHLVEVGMSLKTVEYLVFDEADRLFELGFAEQLTQIMEKLSPTRQTMLFSATLPSKLVEFTKAGLTNPVLLRLDTDTSISPNLKMAFFTVRPQEKTPALLYLLKTVVPPQQQTIVFVATRHHCEYLHELLERADITVTMIYGAMDQTARKINLQRFRQAKAMVLLVTDVAARGIDLPLLDNVINYDFPARAKLFVHRVGRVARAGRSGTAYSLVAPEEVPFMLDLHLFLGRPAVNKVPAGTTYHDSQVYYGNVPSYLLESQIDFTRQCHSIHSDLESLHKVVQNAYKQYAKTRPTPSAESVKRAKELPCDNLHPLFAQEVKSAERARLELLNSLKNFRPPQTILEMGDGDVGSASRRNAKHTSNKLRHTDISEASVMMREKRSRHDAIIQKKQEQVKQSSKQEQTFTEEQLDRHDAEVDEQDETQDLSTDSSGNPETKQKKKNKKKKNKQGLGVKSSKHTPAQSFKDEEFFMSPFPQNQHKEDALSVNVGSEMAEASLDLLADDKQDLMKQRSAMRWDRKKKKFVHASALAEKSKSKKIMFNESGAAVGKNNKLNKYKQWMEKTKARIPVAGEREGTFNAVQTDGPHLGKRFRHKATSASSSAGASSELKTKEQMLKERKRKAKIKEKQQGSRKKRRTGEGHFTPKALRAQQAHSARTRSKVMIYK
ncbi:ATP-dependent RNA helicase DDX54 [Balamuthia mandrillaris]